jgi:hypothetical protein
MEDATSMVETRLFLGPRSPAVFGTSTLTKSVSQVLFEHYINETADLLSMVRGPDNPFITCIIPLARVDGTIMDSVLALSGAHHSGLDSNPDIKLAASTHYALVLRQFKHSLTQFGSAKGSNPANLLLTALMLCHIEVSDRDQCST